MFGEKTKGHNLEIKKGGIILLMRAQHVGLTLYIFL